MGIIVIQALYSAMEFEDTEALINLFSNKLWLWPSGTGFACHYLFHNLTSVN